SSNDFALARYNADGSLDNDFGNGGKVITGFSGAFSSAATALALQSDGKIVVAGDSRANGSRDFALARYNPDGSLDSGFGNGGKVITDFNNGSDDSARAIVLQADGKIVVGGFSRSGNKGPNGYAL